MPSLATPRLRMFAAGFLILALSPQPAAALDDAHREAAAAAIAQGHAFLRETQADDGSWSPQPGPAVTGLILRAFATEPLDPETNQATTDAALAYVLGHAQPDGSIRSGPDGILANYNTAICVSALSKFPQNPQAQKTIRRATAFLQGLQWQDGMTDAAGNAVNEDHAFFGGAGYGKHGRPDLSNTQIMLQALHDAGLPADDPAFQRALVFITRLQGSDANDFFPQGTIEKDGGAIYATSVNRDLVGVPQSMANPDMIDRARAGQPVSGLRGYGSMTYAAFKSYLYADLKPDDQRVHDARQWIAHNYTLDQNPGMPEPNHLQGLYYYYLTHARALAAYGSPTLETSDGDIDWANHLIDALADRQLPDGSWANPADRWMEGDPHLATAFALLALQEALTDLP